MPIFKHTPFLVTHGVPSQKRVVQELRSVLTKDDAPAAARAVLNDAGTYDVATGTGGFNGSLRLECVLSTDLFG